VIRTERTTCARLKACLKAMKMKTPCASEEPLKLSESDLSKLMLPALVLEYYVALY